MNSNCILDATDESHAPGRYINDGKRAGRAVNVEFGAGTHPATCKQTGRKYVSIFATRNITAGDDGVELLADYGPDYEWSPQPTTIARGSIIKPTRGAKPPATRRLGSTGTQRTPTRARQPLPPSRARGNTSGYRRPNLPPGRRQLPPRHRREAVNWTHRVHATRRPSWGTT